MDRDRERPDGRAAPRLLRTDEQVEVIVHGDETREHLASRLVEHLPETSAAALRLLCDFLKESFGQEREAFELISIEVFAATAPDGGDVALTYYFTPDADPEEYGYTYFEVVLACHGPPRDPFRPFRFTVGFH
jgi:hypothetical protein